MNHNKTFSHEQTAQALAAFRQARPEITSTLLERALLHLGPVAESHDQTRRAMETGIDFITRSLDAAILLNSQALLEDQVAWGNVRLKHDQVTPEQVLGMLQMYSSVVQEKLSPAQAEVVTNFLDGLIAQQKNNLAGQAPAETQPAAPALSSLNPDSLFVGTPYAELCQQFTQAVLAGDRHLANRLILESVQGGTRVKDIYLHVFQLTQREVGRLWQTNQISVAQEHLASGVTQLIMSQLYPLIFSSHKNGRKFMGACVSGELHEIGIRMVADFFEMDGWDTYYLGANMPVQGLLQMMHQIQPDVVGISVMMGYHLPSAVDMIAAMRAEPGGAHTKIVVGGYPFLVEPELAQKIGADGWAADAEQAVELANRLLNTN
jgi:MerR family transcriptional regulator, light-induced transcriptional regulator